MVSSGAVIMPPTIGAAVRRITSEPVPLPNMIGSRPAITTATVMASGRTRSAFHDRLTQVAHRFQAPFVLVPLQSLVDVNQHHHAKFRRNARQYDESRPPRRSTY